MYGLVPYHLWCIYCRLSIFCKDRLYSKRVVQQNFVSQIYNLSKKVEFGVDLSRDSRSQPSRQSPCPMTVWRQQQSGMQMHVDPVEMHVGPVGLGCCKMLSLYDTHTETE